MSRSPRRGGQCPSLYHGQHSLSLPPPPSGTWLTTIKHFNSCSSHIHWRGQILPVYKNLRQLHSPPCQQKPPPRCRRGWGWGWGRGSGRGLGRGSGEALTQHRHDDGLGHHPHGAYTFHLSSWEKINLKPKLLEPNWLV